MRNPLPALIALIKQRRREAIAAAAIFLFLLFLLFTYQLGDRISKKQAGEHNQSAQPEALETSFERWYRGENGELLASFFLFNHCKRTVGRIEIVCAAYTADNRLSETYRQQLSVTLLPGEVRHLSKTYMGKLDPQAKKAVCRIESWE